jgi:acyl carrier protein
VSVKVRLTGNGYDRHSTISPVSIGVYTFWESRYTCSPLMTPIELIRSAVFSFWRMINVANLENLEEKVINIVSEQLNVAKDEITLSSNYLDDLKADSLDLVELVMEFEDEFGITVPDEDYEKIRTVGDSIAYIKEKAGE